MSPVSGDAIKNLAIQQSLPREIPYNIQDFEVCRLRGSHALLDHTGASIHSVIQASLDLDLRWVIFDIPCTTPASVLACRPENLSCEAKELQKHANSKAMQF